MNRTDSVSRLDLNSVNSAMESNLSGVVRWSDPVNVVCGTSGKAVVVPHNLGVTPTEISVLKWGDTRWWADENDQRTWSDRIVVFHATFGRYTVRAGVQ